MIVSHKHKFIFIKTTKTAGTSVEIALSTICGDEDIISKVSAEDEQTRLEVGGKLRNFYLPFSKYTLKDWIKLLKTRRKVEYYNHMSAAEVKRCVGDEVWNSYFKFCFERNPFDKIISWYYWRGYDKQYASVADSLRDPKTRKPKGYDIYTIDGKIAVDKIYKFEELKEAMADISKRIGLDKPLDLSSIKAKGNVRKDKRAYQEVLSEEEKEMIAKKYAKEIEMFGYKYPGS